MADVAVDGFGLGGFGICHLAACVAILLVICCCFNFACGGGFI